MGNRLTFSYKFPDFCLNHQSYMPVWCMLKWQLVEMRNFSWDAVPQLQLKKRQNAHSQIDKYTSPCSSCNSCEKQNMPELASTNYFLQRSRRKLLEEHSQLLSQSLIYMHTKSRGPSEAAFYSNNITVQNAGTEILGVSLDFCLLDISLLLCSWTS